MLYRQDISGVLAETIGERGVKPRQLDETLVRADAALDTLRQWHREDTLPLLRLPGRRDDLDECDKAAAMLAKGARDILVLGTGGSSLGAQALAQLAGYRVPGVRPFGTGLNEVRYHFFDNLDATTVAEALKTLDLRRTSAFAVSKSGGTPETVVQLLLMLEAFAKAGIDPARRLVALTEPGSPEKNAFRMLAGRHGLKVLDHDPRIGGRYSVLSNVGIVPAMLMGLDPVALRQGAAQVIDPIIDGAKASEVAPALGAAAISAVDRVSRLNAVILMPYSDRLRLFSAWFAQLWAESLGKVGKGSQPVAAAGPVDQHSQMQLFLDGPNDKLLTVVSLATAGKGPKIPRRYSKSPLLSYLGGHAVGDLTAAQARATRETFVRNGRPVRTIHVERLDEKAMGALLMHFMIETIVMGLIAGVDPFDQPAVEQGKVLTREYLAAM
jgi:glucose-6-phosphate isomerase